MTRARDLGWYLRHGFITFREFAALVMFYNALERAEMFAIWDREVHA